MSLPKWYELARAERGVKEASGSADNPVVSAYYADSGFPEITHDSVPWCAAFVGAMLARAGHKPSGSLMARSYLEWGQKLDKPKQGCIVVFPRGTPPSGHVTFFDHEEGGMLVCVGGNQSNAVTEARYSKANVLGYRWPSEATEAKPVSDDKFLRCHAVTASWEGGYVNHPDDPGGATNYGVTQATYDSYRRKKGLSPQSVTKITAAEVRDIYGDYWSAVRGDDLPVGVDLATYDFGVNSGPSRAAKYLQKIVGATQDGIVGPKTLSAVSAMDPDDIAARLCDARLAFLRGLKTWSTFGKGWTNRVNDVRAKSVDWAMQAMKGEEPPVPTPTPDEPSTPGKEEAAGGIVAVILAALAAAFGGIPWDWIIGGAVLALIALIVWWVFIKK